MLIKKIAQTPGIVATVIDNLNSESETDALSAKQGKVLNEKVENYIENTMETISDCNDTTLKTGFYYLGGSAENVPFSSDWILQVMKKNDTKITQILYRYRDNEIYIRHYNTVTETSWKDWTPVLSDTGWKTLTLNTSWANWSSDYFSAQYRKINKQVFLRGLVVNNTNTDYIVGTLPSGYRPSKSIYSTLSVKDSASACYVAPNGNICMATYTKGNWVDLNGVSFFID